MSELIDAQPGHKGLRQDLLTTVSILAFLGFMYSTGRAEAADYDTSRPTVWIELGGQLDHISGDGDSFDPPFLAANASAAAFKPVSPLQAQKAPFFFEHGAEGKLTFKPRGSEWAFTIAVRYGRSNRNEHVHQQSRAPISINYESNYADTLVKRQGSHAILDFEAGKDVGLGILGAHGMSTLSAGVRVAQFSSNAATTIRARPAVQGINGFHLAFDNYYLDGAAARNFRGIGPALSWNALSVLLGNPDATEIVMDFGVNGAVLFGRQKTNVNHHTTAVHYHGKYFSPFLPGGQTQLYSNNAHHTNDRSIVVPNAGGFAAVSVRRADVVVSFGYRADFFFGAVDGGIDMARRSNLGFSGPFTTLSVGFP